jgi:2-oxoglutarate ferredoxin oxidoreductase subunit delta
MATESKKAKGKIKIDRELCKGCHMCVEVCPTHNIEVDTTLNKKGYSPARPKEKPAEGDKGCTACAQCAVVCPEVAIEVYRAQ